MVGKGVKEPEYTSYSTPYEKKDPSLFPPPPRTKTYAPGERPVVPPKKAAIQETEEVESKTYPTGPFRANTLGVDNSKFPKPPPRTGAQDPGVQSSLSSKPAAPKLPPRLPPRNDPPPYSVKPGPEQGYLNQGALGRLGQAGISVPAFGLGKTSTSAATQDSTSPILSQSSGSPQLNGLQNKFVKLNTGSPGSSGQGTTWAEKQGALKTASNLRSDPSSVSLQDMRSAASTAKNFNDRHGEQIASGMQGANQLNQKYGVLNKMQSLQHTGSAGGFKAPPPPVPAKKPVIAIGGPPPIPYGSKPGS
jgi:hypothetical protein